MHNSSRDSIQRSEPHSRTEGGLESAADTNPATMLYQLCDLEKKQNPSGPVSWSIKQIPMVLFPKLLKKYVNSTYLIHL